ncbi:MAG: DMT family transporter [Candidatus Saccharibacteria bacterium]
MKKNKKTENFTWLYVGLLAALLAAPSATVIKVASSAVDPLVFISLRFSIVVLVTAPYMIYMGRRITKKNLQQSLLMGICMTIATLSYVTAISLSQASYVSLVTLSMPVIFIAYSIILTDDRLKKRAALGICLAAVGAFVVVGLPFLMARGEPTLYNPWATFLAIVNCLFFPLAIIFSRKANEQGLPVMASFGFASIVVAVVCSVLAVVFVGINGYVPAGSISVVAPIAYSAIGVALVARSLNVVSYQHLGAVVSGALSYVEYLLAIILPILILGEHLSLEFIVGGSLILAGVYITETQHHPAKLRHLRVMQHH